MTILAMFVSVVSFSQKNARKDSITTTKKDTVVPVPLKYDFKFNQKAPLFLSNPTEKEVVYDKAINKFMMVEKIGNYRIGTPIYMTPREYKKYRLQNDMKTYFKEKIDATNTKKKGTKNTRKNLLPKYYVNSKFFESVFGGNTIEVIPTGQISIKLGGNYQKNENPQISLENQSRFTFEFDQQISASIQAKVGTKLNFTANYDTQSTFDFQNLIKLEYAPNEDDIIRNIDAGNINMPIKNSLINGAQALFGVKTELQFGKTFVTAVYSQQNSQSKTVVAEGGAVIEPFELRATDYDNDRHFFLSQFFRETYKNSLKNYPLISSPINITRVEVWVTNQNASVTDYRSIVAFADLGESKRSNMVSNEQEYVEINKGDLVSVNIGGDQVNIPFNGANKINDLLVETGGIRDVSTIGSSVPSGMDQGTDYSYLQNARKLQPNEYTLHPQLGFISLNRRLNDGEVLGVAYEYTVVGATKGKTVLKVGEFANDGVKAPGNIAVKLLRSEILTTTRTVAGKKVPFPTWQLMMKNVYAIGAYPLQQEGFRFELMYRDDNTGVLQNTFQSANDRAIQNRTLLNLLNLDKLDQSQFTIPNGDGFFDFIEGITVNSQKGYIIFPETEPFGNDLKDVISNTRDQDKYIFEELYTTTKIQAKNEYQNKDKFFLKGYFKSETSRGISLGAFNIPRGSVRVTAGGRQLVEGVDYVVDYQLGRVQILDPGLEASGVPINASVENNTFFNQQRKTFFGVDIEHRFNENFILGGTFLNVSEKPITPKVNYGAEPIDNVMLGMNLDFSSEVPYLTKLANKLPFVDTEAPSNVSVRADMAYLLPGSPRGIDVNGTATSYVDDFEASQVPINLSAPQQWFMASTPISQNLPGKTSDLLVYNNKRAKLAWYTIDQLFYTGNSSNRPSNIDDVELSRDEVRQVKYDELFPETDLDITQINLVRTLDLAYYPSQRGPYNFNTNLSKERPEDNWGGIMRPLTTNNFEQANVEYIQFWLLDPYNNYSITEAEGLPAGVDHTDPANQVGDLFINLGNISEDILRDNVKQYENGLPTTNTPSSVTTSVWGKVPKNPSILYAFNADPADRAQQDVGLDGLNDEEEKKKFPDFANLPDPAGDNFQFFRGGALDAAKASILTRYKDYNNTQGNSPTIDQSNESFPTSSTTYPDVEDINKDQTMNPVNSYFEYRVSLNKSDLVKGSNNIVDVKTTSVPLPNGQSRTATWYQFRIPVRNVTDAQKFGGITDFNSIRFMRMFLKGFKIPVVLRFGDLELVRGDWRRYTKTLPEKGESTDLTEAEINNFEVGVVSVEQNPQIYQLPPGIQREQLQGTNRIQRQNEQSITLKVKDLPVDNTRAVYKNISIDMRRYKTLKMFLHAEKSDNLTAIIRLGTDLDENYYEIEKPLKKSTSSATSLDVWPEVNNLDIPLEELGKLKLQRDAADLLVNEVYKSTSSNGLQIRVKGNPTLAQVRTVMLGVKNTSSTNQTGEVWFNELRAVDFDNKGGWAAVLSADANFSDVMNLSLAGRMSTIGFGNIEDRVQQRSIEEVKQYDVATNVSLGKMMPKSWNMQVPMSYSYGEEIKNPKYDPQYQDVTIEEAKAVNPNSNNAQDYTRRKSISFINVKKNRNPESKKKPKFYDIENVSVSYSFNEEYHKDYNIERYINQNLMMGANYNFNFKPFVIEPFKKSKAFKGRYWKLLKDLNFNLMPKVFSLNSKINRNFNQQQSRNLIEGLSPQPTLTQRRFMFDWDYTVGFDVTRSLQLNFNATNNYIYDSFGNGEELEIFDKVLTVGRRNNYHQKLNGTYKIPIDKIPFLNFIKADYGYTADFDWQANAQSQEIQSKVGNMIQNANTHNLNANLNFDRFYKTIGLKDLFVKNTRKSKTKKGSKSKKIAKRKVKKKATAGQKILKGVYDVITSVKRAKVSFSQNNGTTLQGYKPTVDLFGVDRYGGSYAPTFGFVFGSQTAILNKAIQNGWLVSRTPTEEYYNKNYGKTRYDKLDYTVAVKPFKDLTIDFQGNRIKTSTITQQIDVINDKGRFYQNTTIKPFETGNYSISHFMLPTAFKNSEALYQNFLNYRSTIASRLSSSSGLPVSGFTNQGQQVLLPAFLAAYSGNNPATANTGIFRNIPLPNWRLRYNGLMKYKWFKNNFSAFTISHGYKSSYTIANFTNNLQYEAGKNVTNVSGNYQPELLISSATLIDEFSPLVRLDMKMRNSFSIRGEVKKDRSLTLNLNNNTLTDIKGTEYVIGLGYRIKDVKFKTKFTGRKQTVKGDINLRADISLRDNLSLIRSIDELDNQVTGGERLFGLKVMADYNLSKNLTTSFYYNHQTFDYAISTTFPRQSINAGLNIIYNLGN